MTLTIAKIVFSLYAGLAAASYGSDGLSLETQPYYRQLCVDTKKPFFAAAPQPGDCVRYEPSRPGAITRNNSFVMPKPAGMKYVFLIGESNAALLAGPNPEKKGDVVFRVAGALGHPAKAVNCGMGSYDSERTYAVMEEVMGYSPDAIVVLVGNSENSDACHGIWRRLKERYYMGMNLLFWHLPPAKIRKKFLLDNQALMLARMSRLARKNKVKLVFCTLPANLSDFPPWGTLPLEHRDFAEGWEYSAAGDHSSAGRMYLKYVSERPEDAMGQYYLGKTLLKLGKAGPAREAFIKAADNNIEDNSCPGTRNEMIRRTAKETGTPLADLEEAFQRAAPSGIPGGSMFDDKTHWPLNYNMLAACEIMARLSETGGIFASPEGSAWETPLCRAARTTGPTPPPYREKDRKKTVLAKYLSFRMKVQSNFKAPQLGVSEDLVMLMQRIYELDREYLLRISASPEALRANTCSRTPAQLPGGQCTALSAMKGFWPYYLAHLGETLRREGETALSIGYFDRSLAAKVPYLQARFYRGLAYLKMGKEEKALTDLSLSPLPRASALNAAESYGFAEALKEKLGVHQAGAVKAPPENVYYVYGGAAELSGKDGLYPEKHGYRLLGSARSGGAVLFPGAYARYAVVARDNSLVRIDALELSDGSFYSGGFSDSNVQDWDGANGAPDGRCAAVGGIGGGFLLASPGPGAAGIKIHSVR